MRRRRVPNLQPNGNAIQCRPNVDACVGKEEDEDDDDETLCTIIGCLGFWTKHGIGEQVKHDIRTRESWWKIVFPSYMFTRSIKPCHNNCNSLSEFQRYVLCTQTFAEVETSPFFSVLVKCHKVVSMKSTRLIVLVIGFLTWFSVKREFPCIVLSYQSDVV